MHKIFCILEILGEIFSYSSKHTNTVTARVCRIWFTRSIPFIWDRVKLNDALSVLSPLIANDGSFQHPLLPQSWERFLSYSKHVRYLECFDIQYTALSQATFWRPFNTDLFSSKLTILNWKGSGKHLDCLPPFLTPILRVLFISLDVIEKPDTLNTLFKTIGFRSPLLRAFEISIPPTRNHALQISRSLGELMSLLLELISVSIPINFMTPELFTILSHLPRVEDILSIGLNINYAEELLERDMTAHEESEESLPFRSLRQIYISDATNNQTFTIAKALGQGIPLFGLARLWFSPYCEDSDQIIALMESVPTMCPNIHIVTLHGHNCSSGRLPLQAIQTLLQCQDLHTLEVYKCTVDMELEDMVSLATSRVFWRTIALPSSKALDYQALVAFAQNCPQLVKLSLKLDYNSEFPHLGTDVWFSSLTTLSVGDSAVTSPVEVGLFLSSICGESLKIEATGNHASSWKIVEKMVNYVKKTARVKILEKEMASLQKTVSKRTVKSTSSQTVGKGVEASELVGPESIRNYKPKGSGRRRSF